ncbi:senescence/dehydration-associated protein At4g35985, chloroplastic-like [Syzygium oleosum]|uniref:senescence/dehydration-associated protein At4g35985, chloroplastic-like n=1 Tax=Syzygium oleosum TaxID=219896 RepID=UPI0024BB61E8|nr:senescence/dehydration-associated protein At4g35985, chloroplastic-like [Syzygium oleosum]
MGCFRCGTSKASMRTSSSSEPALSSNREHPYPQPQARALRQEALLTIPSCTVHLMEEGEALELLPSGEFTLLRISDENVPLATIVKVGDDLQWPLTKDEPVVKLDPLHYLFTLPVKDGDPLSYGVTFAETYGGGLSSLDAFLQEHSCFSASTTSSRNKNINWKEFAPKVGDYNNVLARAIAGGTGQIVKGIFKCSNAYTNQVHQGGEMIITRAAENSNITYPEYTTNGSTTTKKKSAINRNLKRVRKVSKMTEKMSKTMLDGVQFASGSVMAPVVKSQAGKAFLAMVPGEVLLASLDAVNKVLDAAEAAEKQAFSATSKAATRMVSQRFGESAGEATEDALATAGHCASTAWNIFKIRKTINPASSVSSGVLRNVAKVKSAKSSKL